MTAGGEGVSTPKPGYLLDAPLFAEGRAACSGLQLTWVPRKTR